MNKKQQEELIKQVFEQLESNKKAQSERQKEVELIQAIADTADIPYDHAKIIYNQKVRENTRKPIDWDTLTTNILKAMLNIIAAIAFLLVIGFVVWVLYVIFFG